MPGLVFARFRTWPWGSRQPRGASDSTPDARVPTSAAPGRQKRHGATKQLTAQPNRGLGGALLPSCNPRARRQPRGLALEWRGEQLPVCPVRQGLVRALGAPPWGSTIA